MDKRIKLTRTCTFERSAINEEELTAEFSFSSEFPVTRKNGMEVLSHREGDYSFDHLNDNAPLLMGHDTQRQLGVVTSAWVSGDKGYAKVKFSRSQAGQEAFNDVMDGIAGKVSVGYFAYDPILERSGDTNTFRYKWTPYEVSLVSIPADPSVGFFRAEEQSVEIEIPNKIELPQTDLTELSARSTIIMEDKNLTVDDVIASIETETRSAEVEQITRGASPADVDKLCAHFRLESEAEGLIARSATLEEVKTHLQAKWRETSAKTRSLSAPSVHTRHQEPVSNAKALLAASTGNWSNAGLEREHSQELARQSGKTMSDHSFFIDPNQTRVTPVTANGATTTSFGKDFVGTQYMPERLIDTVWNKTFLNQLGTDSLTGLQQNVAFPVITSNGTASFIGENTDMGSPQDIGTGLKSVSPKLLVSSFAFSKQMLAQGLPNIESKVMDQIFNAIAQKLDAVALTNSGTTLSTLGLLNDITNVISLGTNGAAPKLADLVGMQKSLANLATLTGNLKYASSASAFFGLQTTLKDSGNTNSGYIVQSYDNPTIGGLPLVWSQNIPNNLTKGSGTNLSAIILGNWDDFLVAQWGAIEVQVDPYTQANAAQIVVRSYSFWDMVIKRLASFVVVKDAIL